MIGRLTLPSELPGLPERVTLVCYLPSLYVISICLCNVNVARCGIPPKWGQAAGCLKRINLYPVDNEIGFPNTYPMDSDLSGG